MDDTAVWYFAYGSNMSSAVMVRRGMTPMDAKNVVVETHVLVFDVFGVPFTEPAMAGVRRRPAHHSGPQVHGVAYRLSVTDYNRLKVSEGAGTAYREIFLDAQVLSEMGPPVPLRVRTFAAKFPFDPARLPSARYMVRTTPPPRFFALLCP